MKVIITNMAISNQKFRWNTFAIAFAKKEIEKKNGKNINNKYLKYRKLNLIW